MLSPITVALRIFFQKLWKENLSWDEALPCELSQEWKTLLTLTRIDHISLPRWLGYLSQDNGVEIHGFADASQHAFAAVVYVRTARSRSEFKTVFVIAKTRNAPIKRITIPRLELSAAVLLARLVAYARITLSLMDVPIHLWTDSTIALAWIQSDANRWKEFVGTRVAMIQSLVPQAQWRHVSGIENPADLATRGLSSREDLSKLQLWWEGPPWLQSDSTLWPVSLSSSEDDLSTEEKSSTPRIHLLAATEQEWTLLSKYSSLTKLLRITIYVQRALLRFKGKLSSHGPLLASEFHDAAIVLSKVIQKTHFQATLENIRQHLPLEKNHPMSRLAPFIDSQGVLRVGGRLQFSQISYESKHQIILPRASAFTTLVINQAHSSTLHGGTQLTLATIRRNYWIIGGRNPVRSFILKCVRCARFRAAAANQTMSPLPAVRGKPSRPFLHSGVDYAGPYLLKNWHGRNSRTYKAFLVVFVCLSTSASHLEVATNYSTDGFLAAYRRFVSRRGICATLRSDQGTNFIGADAELRRMFTSAHSDFQHLTTSLAAEGTQWIFNPPSSPHFGGKWEAAVKSAKHHIRRVIGTSLLTYEEFTTFLTLVEAVLNSRPLCPLSQDSSDLEVLTPGHFLTGDALTAVPEPSLVDIPLNRLTRWQLMQQFAEHLWNRWKEEYLQTIKDVTKWRYPSHTFKEGDLVLVKDERYPQLKWPLARITKCHPGRDNRTRVFTIKTKTGDLVRPITKLCPLITV